MNTKTYKVVRKFKNDDMQDDLMAEGLTLAEAKAWCSDKESSSRTCSTKEGQLLTLHCGDWFDSFEEE